MQFNGEPPLLVGCIYSRLVHTAFCPRLFCWDGPYFHYIYYNFHLYITSSTLHWNACSASGSHSCVQHQDFVGLNAFVSSGTCLSYNYLLSWLPILAGTKGENLYINNVPENTTKEQLKKLFPNAADIILPVTASGTSMG